MPYLEFEGKNVEKATKEASEKLGISLDKLVYDVISYGSSGIFGLVRTKKARIRVNMPEEEKEKKETLAVSSNLIEVKKVEEEVLEDKSDLEELEELDDDDIENEEVAIIEDKEEADLDDEIEEDEDEEVDENAVVSDKAIEWGVNVLNKIIEFTIVEATVKLEKQNNRILFRIEGGDSKSLVGKRGQTLESIQYLIDRIVNKHNDKKVRVQVDIEDYLDSRKKSLRSLAIRLAKKARLTGKPTSLGEMNAYDRKIVHLALKNDNGVRTQSMGEGYYRKLLIFPKRGQDRRSGNNGKYRNRADR
ncbi:MAG: Jag N-terminal domain-containing protein [Desulfobacterales bacterium]|nr:Jag N-terminal domain-containing protein [Desulfobacterales bacterium]MBF0398389.1 Jag N-terminal domain-containing protein [Desulfobacterales bacterium]